MSAQEQAQVAIEGLAEAKLVLLLSAATSPPEWIERCLEQYIHTFQRTDKTLLILHDPDNILPAEDLADHISNWTNKAGHESGDIILLEQTEPPFSACHIYFCLARAIAHLPGIYQAIHQNCMIILPEDPIYQVFPSTAHILTLTTDAELNHVFARLKTKPEDYVVKTRQSSNLLIEQARQLAKKIRAQQKLSNEEVLPVLSAQEAPIRQQINCILGKALLDTKRYEEALPFMERAWLISNHDPELFPDYLTVLKNLKHFEKIAECYRLLGHRAADQHEIDAALDYFQGCFSVYHLFAKSDRFLWHEDIAEKITALATPWLKSPGQGNPLSENRKIKLGHVVYDITEPISVLMKHSLTLIQHHNRTLFDVYCFIPQSETIVMSNKHACQMIERLKAAQCQIIFGPETYSAQIQMCALADRIAQLEIDVLLVNLQMAMTSMAFLTGMRPAPVMIGLNHGHPYMFSSRLLDWNIAWSCYPLIDSIGNCTLVYGALDLARIKNTALFQRENINASDSQPLILMSSGRPLKYHCADYWFAICDILIRYPHCEYWVIGITAEQLDFWSQIPESVKPRINFLGWQSSFDSFRWLGMADIYLDTFPTGGGFAMYEAMAVGLPAISFENDYTRLFDPSDWSPAYEYFQVPELIAPRWDYAAFRHILSHLIENPEQRQDLGHQVQEKVWQYVGNPAEMTRQTESVILDVLGRVVTTYSETLS